MSIKEAESSIAVLEAELAKLDAMDPHADELRLQIDHLREEAMMQLDAWDTVYLARHPKRPKAADSLPSMPAIPTISPRLTFRSSPLTASSFRSFFTTRF